VEKKSWVIKMKIYFKHRRLMTSVHLKTLFMPLFNSLSGPFSCWIKWWTPLLFNLFVTTCGISYTKKKKKEMNRNRTLRTYTTRFWFGIFFFAFYQYLLSLFPQNDTKCRHWFEFEIQRRFFMRSFQISHKYEKCLKFTTLFLSPAQSSSIEYEHDS
jgi:hypothetical protein